LGPIKEHDRVNVTVLRDDQQQQVELTLENLR
jgi:hypothetical protein